MKIRNVVLATNRIQQVESLKWYTKTQKQKRKIYKLKQQKKKQKLI